MTTPDREEPTGNGLSETELVTEEDDFISLSMPRTGFNVDEILSLAGQQMPNETETVFRHMFKAFSSLAEIPEVRGVILQVHEEIGPRLVYVVDELTPDTPNTSRVMQSISMSHLDLERVAGSRIGHAYGNCRGDFDEYLSRFRQRELNGIPENKRNPLTDLLEMLNSGFKTVGAIKIE